MTLSIITINRNNASGLDTTIQSVLAQTETDFEYIIVDGASTDGSVDVIKQYDKCFNGRLKWVSESDNGIYDAMNKGIRMASGVYLEFLNSGDCLVAEDVVSKMFAELGKVKYPSILYGNLLKDMPDGTILKDRCFAGREITFLGFYTGTLNHSPAYIRRNLFDKYGLYDESLKIVSDWKWYLQTIIFGGETPIYADIDVTLFDMTGISETNRELEKQERRQVLEELITPAILTDYDQCYFSIQQMKRLSRYPWAYKIVWFIERCLFKMEKRQRKHLAETQYL